MSKDVKQVDEMSTEELQALVDARNAAKPITEAAVGKIIDAKFDELKALLIPKVEEVPKPEETPEQIEMKALRLEIETLKKGDGGTPTLPGGSKTSKTGDDESQKELQPWEDPNNPMNAYAISRGRKWKKEEAAAKA